MKMFELMRHEDATGVSGTGVVAEGVEFSDGSVVLRWVVGEHRSTVYWPGIESVKAIHGHDGKTELMWREGAEYVLADKLGTALRLTQEYVGADTLPALPGWSWFDALEEHAEARRG